MLLLEIHPRNSTSCSFFDLWNRVAEFLLLGRWGNSFIDFTRSKISLVVRAAGIKPATPAWKADVIIVSLRPHGTDCSAEGTPVIIPQSSPTNHSGGIAERLGVIIAAPIVLL